MRHHLTKQRHDYTNEATELFIRFASKHNLSYTVAEAPIEVLWQFPVQEKLCHPIALGLQNNDELNFGVGDFWSYFFPFTDKHDTFLRVIDRWVEGHARIVPKPGLFIQTMELQVLTDGVWEVAYGASSISFHKSTYAVLTNLDEKEMPSQT